MSPIVTDVERVHHHSTPRSPRGARVLRRVGIPALTVVSVLTSTVFVATRPVAGDAISDAKAKAAAIEAQLTQAQNQMSALSQQYDQAQYQLSQINSSIATTKANVAADEQAVAKNRATLSKAAVANYITDGTASAQNPIFSGNEQTLGATTEYNKIAEGDISLAVDNLHTAEQSLNAQEGQLQGEQSQAQSQVTAEQNAVAQNAQAIQSQKSALAQEQGQIATLVQQQQQAEAAAAAQAAKQKQAGSRRSCSRRGGCSGTVFRGKKHSRRGSRSQPGRRPAHRRRRRWCPAGSREPGGRSLRVGRRIPQGLGQPRLRLFRADCLGMGPGGRRPPPLLGRPDGRLDARSRSVTCSRATSSSTVPAAPSTSPCTRRGLHDRGALHGRSGLGDRPPARRRLRRRRPAVAGSHRLRSSFHSPRLPLRVTRAAPGPRTQPSPGPS